MKRYFILLSLFLCAALLLSGCYSEVGIVTEGTEGSAATTDEPVTDDIAATETTTASNDADVSTEEIHVTTYPAPNVYSRSAYPGTNILPADNGGYYSIRYGATTVSYIGEDGTRMPLCGRGGCNHNDETCPAYFLGLSRFSEHNGRYYVASVVNEIGNSFVLYEVDSVSGTRNALYTKKTDEEHYFTMQDLVCTDNALYCLLSHSDLQGESNMILESVYPDSGDAATLYETSERESIWILGAVSAGAVVQISVLTEMPMEYPDYHAKNPDATDDDYDEYYFKTIEENTKNTLEILAPDGTVVDTLATSADGYDPPSMSQNCWGEFVLYRLNDCLYCYDSTTGESSLLEEDENLVNYAIFDGHAEITYRIDGAYSFAYLDIFTGEKFSYPCDSLSFGIYGETDDKFIGVSEDGCGVIDKQDYYRGDLDKAQVLVKFQ